MSTKRNVSYDGDASTNKKPRLDDNAIAAIELQMSLNFAPNKVKADQM